MRCLCFLCPSAAIDSALAAARAGFELIDLRITLYAEPGNTPGTTVSEVPIRTARPDDTSALRELAGTQFRYTRFWADARFPRDRAAELYRVWIEKDLKNDQGCVLVSESSGELARLNLVETPSIRMWFHKWLEPPNGS